MTSALKFAPVRWPCQGEQDRHRPVLRTPDWCLSFGGIPATAQDRVHHCGVDNFLHQVVTNRIPPNRVLFLLPINRPSNENKPKI